MNFIRLSKLAIYLNTSTGKVVRLLNENGLRIDNNPNQKINLIELIEIGENKWGKVDFNKLLELFEIAKNKEKEKMEENNNLIDLNYKIGTHEAQLILEFESLFMLFDILDEININVKIDISGNIDTESLFELFEDLDFQKYTKLSAEQQLLFLEKTPILKDEKILKTENEIDTYFSFTEYKNKKIKIKEIKSCSIKEFIERGEINSNNNFYYFLRELDLGVKSSQYPNQIELKNVFAVCKYLQIDFDLIKNKIENEINRKLPNLLDIKNEINKMDIKTRYSNSKVMQKIIFGSPGTGKSYMISGSKNEHSILKKLGIKNEDGPNCIKTIFHPEYTYGDFMGKLLPLSDESSNITYQFYEGHFLKAISQAFKNYLNKDEDKIENVLLVIDEINRGNSAAIFGSIFQLLDRDSEGFSEYEINLSKMEYDRLITLIFPEFIEIVPKERPKKIASKLKDNETLKFLLNGKIKIPPNLHIVATMNTSDNSIYFMDSAFKRRWDWEFIDVTSIEEKELQRGRKIENKIDWTDFVDNLNYFIKNECKSRKVEDKQIGYYFIKGKTITKEQIKNKLMFFLWDSVFSNDKRPLENLLSKKTGHDIKLVTFGDFISHTENFIEKIRTLTEIHIDDLT